MLVAYYIHRRNLGSTELMIDSEDSQLIRRWVITLGFQGLLGLQTNNTFKTYRNAVRRAVRQENSFPWEAIAEAFRGMGRPMDFNRESLARWCNTSQDNHPQAELLLSLIYADDLPNLQRRSIPVLQSRFFLPEEMRRAGVSEVMAPVLQGFSGKLILSVALDAREQEDYFALTFEQWAQTLSPATMRMHCLPEDINLYRLDRLPDWVSERRRLLEMKLAEIASACRQHRSETAAMTDNQSNT